jgi:hypothetical protein
MPYIENGVTVYSGQDIANKVSAAIAQTSKGRNGMQEATVLLRDAIGLLGTKAGKNFLPLLDRPMPAVSAFRKFRAPGGVGAKTPIMERLTKAIMRIEREDWQDAARFIADAINLIKRYGETPVGTTEADPAELQRRAEGIKERFEPKEGV